MNTLHRVAHDDEQTGPLLLRELSECSHYPRMDPLFVGLSQTHDQNAAMLLITVF